MKIKTLNEKLDILLETKQSDFLQRLISWVFEHAYEEEAYHKYFWIEEFNLTEEDIVKYGISWDLVDEEEE